MVAGWVQLSKGNPAATPSAKSGHAASAAKPVSEAEALLQAGIKQGQIHDLPGAARTFKRVLELDSDNKLAWYNLGVIAQHDNRTADALAAYDKALKTDPGFESALYNKAILVGPSDTDQAIAILQRIVAADPKAATAYLNLGHALAKKDHDEEARGAFDHAIQADPSLQQLVPEQFKGSASATPSPSVTQAGTN
ncbi:hypothetical protein UK12_31100 [Saccharothrix sp. ST-888]|nr:hypothetical protein UK12_31100 [Saccharothrix sp. ST-888]